MNKLLFVETINAIKSQYEHDTKCSEAFKLILPNDYTSSYDNHWVINQLIKLLQIEFKDNHKDSWIEYFIYELDFGKKHKLGYAKTDLGEPINLSTAEYLFDFLKYQH